MYNINNEGTTKASNLLTNCTKNVILSMSTEELLELINMTKQQKKEQEILKQHIENFYHIWENDKGVHLSYLPDPEKPKGRKPVTASTRDKLERKIIDFYLKREAMEQDEAEKSRLLCLKDIYPLWLEVKRLETTATSYIRRIDGDWIAYYKDDPIIHMDIRSFKKAGLKEWALKKIRDRELTKTQYYNMSIIIRQCLDYAVDHELIPINPYNQFKVEGKLFRKVKKPLDEKQVFLTSERPLIEAEAWNDYREKNCTSALAIPLIFQIGVRIGELVALKESDISPDGKYIHVQRMAQRQAAQRPDGSWQFSDWKVVEHTKSSAGDRQIFLTTEARRIIQEILQANKENGFYDNGYLFVDKGKRINPRAVDCRIRKYCDHININRKSSHKIRKTFISSLIDGGISINEIRKQAGHESEQVTLHCYSFNRRTINENEADIEKALAV